MLARMEEIRSDIISRAAAALQRHIRSSNARIHFQQLRHATLLTQRGPLPNLFAFVSFR